ncbi:MAG TPA: MOSC domain-containing protein, partial [Myxococcaceae bacterium]|nr:MOSC domain-containing protein [Myxococcaceae bacterium]
YLGQPVRLVHIGTSFQRPLNPDYVPEGGDVGFADGYPLLVLSDASVAELNRRLAEPLPMNRFRPNLVVTGCPAFAEDAWKRIRVGEVVLHIVKPCERCAITTVDQATGEQGKEPLATLATFRRYGGGVAFGQNAVHQGPGRIRVGDAVELLA